MQQFSAFEINIDNFLTKIQNLCLDLAFTININGSELTPDLEIIYSEAIVNGAYANKVESESYYTKLTFNLFLSAWPIVTYLQTLTSIIGDGPVYQSILAKTKAEQALEMQKLLLEITIKSAQQTILLECFKEQKIFSPIMLQYWNQNQTLLLKMLTRFYKICSQVYLNTESIKVKEILMQHESGMAWLKIMFNEKSHFMSNSLANKKQQAFIKAVYFWTRLASLFTLICAITLIFIGSSKWRDIYVLTGMLAIIIVICTFVHKYLYSKKSDTNLLQAQEFLAKSHNKPEITPIFTLPDQPEILRPTPGVESGLLLHEWGLN